MIKGRSPKSEVNKVKVKKWSVQVNFKRNGTSHGCSLSNLSAPTLAVVEAELCNKYPRSKITDIVIYNKFYTVVWE